jgi:CRISPR-associated protein Cas5d
MEIAGNTAMWTRPDTGDCPVSYPAPTYSAVKAIFESVLWGPAIFVIPHKVEICSPIQFHSYHTNYGGPLRKGESVKSGDGYQLLATVLIDVCYKLYAVAIPNKRKNEIPEKSLQWDKNTTSPGHAYQDIFNRRLKRGQCFAIPCLGWKEFTPSYFGPLRNTTNVLADLQPLKISSMLRDVFPNGYRSPLCYTFDQDIVINNGVLEFSRKEICDDK